MGREKGITLIALVITIIVLLILAGISIQLLLGENGIITKAKKGKGDYEESAVREKVELALVDYNSDKITKGEEGEIEEALNKLLDNHTFEDIEIEEKIGIIDDYEITLGKEKGEVIIDGIDKVTGSLRLRCKLNTKEYAKEGVIIIVKATGNVVKVIKPDNTEAEAINGQVEFNYPISSNGVYLFKVEDVEGNSIEKQVIVNNIDTLQPKDFTIEATAITGSGFTIVGQTEDEEATQTSACSGIDRYEYFVKKVTEENYPDEPYKTNEITGLGQGKYNVYAVAYDKAGNEKQTNTIEVSISPKFVKVSAGASHFAAIDTEGHLWTWGDNRYYELGDGTQSSSWIPKMVLPEYTFRDVSMATSSTIAVDSTGDLWAWGFNIYGGDVNHTYTAKVPTRVLVGENIVKVCNSDVNFMALAENGDVWEWGQNVKKAYHASPIKTISGFNFIAIDSGNYSRFAMDNNGKLWGWGQSDYKVFDNGIDTPVYTEEPVRILPNITLLNETKLNTFSINQYSGVAIDSNGNVYTWGNQDQGQLGNGKANGAYSSSMIKEEVRYKNVSFGDKHCLAMDSDGNIWSWGLNNSGQLGNGNKNNTNVPIKVKDGNFRQVSAGKGTSAAIDENGDLWTWGAWAFSMNTYTTIPTKVQI